MDVLILSRLQFAGTIMFHYLFPPLSIGLALIMVIFEGMWLKTGQAVWESAARFWTKIFALNFALGVASGIVMEFQFGTNWAAYSRFVGDVFGSALAAEGIFAFFLESGFLAVLVFGWDRVSRKMHFFSTWMVFLGSVFSAVWIVPVLNVLAIANIPRAIHLSKSLYAFLSSSATIAALASLFAAAIFPNFVVSTVDPAYSVNIFNARSSEKTLGIMLMVALIGMPCVLSYTVAIYWTFRGKVKLDRMSY